MSEAFGGFLEFSLDCLLLPELLFLVAGFEESSVGKPPFPDEIMSSIAAKGSISAEDCEGDARTAIPMVGKSCRTDLLLLHGIIISSSSLLNISECPNNNVFVARLLPPRGKGDSSVQATIFHCSESKRKQRRIHLRQIIPVIIEAIGIPSQRLIASIELKDK